MDPVVAGCTRTRQGGIVGMPRYMLEEDIDWRNLRFKTHYNKMFKGFKIPENISLEDQQELRRLLTVTPEEQQFLMSSSLAQASSFKVFLDVALAFLLWVYHYTFAYKMNNRLGLFDRHRIIRVGIQGKGFRENGFYVE